VPAETAAADDSRCHHDRCNDCRRDDNWPHGRDDDRTAIRLTSSKRTWMKASTASAGSAGTVDTGE
jgi:hypothetical protein